MNSYDPTIFKGLTKPDIDQALQVFSSIDVGPETVLIEEGEVDPTIAVVERGELAIITGDTVLGRVGAGDMVGEMALFGSGLRTASVVSVTGSRLLILDRDGYNALRSVDHPVATNIEEHALHLLSDRLRKVSDRIAVMAHGQDEDDFTPAPGFFDRVATAFGSGGIMYPGKLDGVAILKQSSLFRGVPDDLLGSLAKHFHPVGARRGHFLCTEGDRGDDMYILASGEVDVIVDTAEDRVEQLATLKAGDAFGMCALVQPANPRMASCVARTKVTGLSMGRMTFAGLIPRNDGVGAVLRIALIRAMADQLAYANSMLAMLDSQRQRSARTEREVEAIMRAAAALETHGEYLGADGQDLSYLYE